MALSRRDFLKGASAVGGALAVATAGLWRLPKAMASTTGQDVVWLQGAACTGCSVSLLNSIYYATIDKLLINTLDLKYHPNLMAAAGDTAVAAAEAARTAGGYVLVVEGAIPTGDSGKFCYVWPGKTAAQALQDYAANAALIVAVGTCAAFGGVSGATVDGAANPTGAQGISALLPGKTVVNIPGCPAHPDWIVGTVAYVLTNGKAPPLDANNRPTDFFGSLVHDNCPNRPMFNTNYAPWMSMALGQACLACHSNTDTSVPDPRHLGMTGCLFALGCKGPRTYADCPIRKWNGGAASTPGVNWCIGAKSPCHGCTEPDFPDGKSPFFVLNNG